MTSWNENVNDHNEMTCIITNFNISLDVLTARDDWRWKKNSAHTVSTCHRRQRREWKAQIVLAVKVAAAYKKKRKSFQKKNETFNMWKKLPTFLRSLSHDKFLNNFCMLSTCCRRRHTWKVRMRSGFKLKSLITSRDKHARLFIREKEAGVRTEARQWRQGAKLSYELPNRSSSSIWRSPPMP